MECKLQRIGKSNVLRWFYECEHLLSFSSFTPEIVHRNVDRTNVIYGELNPSVRNVYSTHGQLDPWRAMGVQEDINEFSPTVILPRKSLFIQRKVRLTRNVPSAFQLNHIVLIYILIEIRTRRR